MAQTAISPENFEERVVWYSIIGTYGFYMIGALYILAPVIAWVLFAHLLSKAYHQTEHTPEADRVQIPLGIWVWVIAILIMQVALVMGHLDYQLGIGKLIKSSIGWAKGWALIALFPLIGAGLNIRPQLIYRAACIVCYHTLLLLPLFIGAYLLKLPQVLFVSPLKAVGGPGPEFFSFMLYGIDGGEGTPRWRFFTPWAPAAGFVANVYFIFALQEKDRKWMWLGITGCLAMILLSKSRLALVSMVMVPVLTWGLSNLSRPFIHFLAAPIVLALSMAATQIIDAVNNAIDKFRSARAGSSRVREALGDIAVQRWRDEAPLWGHGIVERGPHLVEYMPIGSHHSWYGLLFVKGAVGFGALAVPMLWSFLAMIAKAQADSTCRVALAMLLIFFFYTFGENLEVLAYLFWPGLVILGIGHRRAWQNPLQQPTRDLDTAAGTGCKKLA